MKILGRIFKKLGKQRKPDLRILRSDYQHRICFAPTWFGGTEMFPFHTIHNGLVLVVGGSNSQKLTMSEILYRNEGFRTVGELRTEPEWSDALEKAREEKITAPVEAQDVRSLVALVSSRKRDGVFIGAIPLFPVSEEDRTLAREADIHLGAIMWPLVDLSQLRDLYGGPEESVSLLENARFKLSV